MTGNPLEDRADLDAQNSGLLNLPADVFAEITDYLDGRDARTLCLSVCRGLRYRNRYTQRAMWRDPLIYPDMPRLTIPVKLWTSFTKLVDRDNHALVKRLRLPDQLRVHQYRFVQDNFENLRSLDITACYIRVNELRMITNASWKLFARLKVLRIPIPWSSSVGENPSVCSHFPPHIKLSRTLLLYEILPHCTGLVELDMQPTSMTKGMSYHRTHREGRALFYECQHIMFAVARAIVRNAPSTLERINFFEAHQAIRHLQVFLAMLSSLRSLKSVGIGLGAWLQFLQGTVDEDSAMVWHEMARIARGGRAPLTIPDLMADIRSVSEAVRLPDLRCCDDINAMMLNRKDIVALWKDDDVFLDLCKMVGAFDKVVSPREYSNMALSNWFSERFGYSPDMAAEPLDGCLTSPHMYYPAPSSQQDDKDGPESPHSIRTQLRAARANGAPMKVVAAVQQDLFYGRTLFSVHMNLPTHNILPSWHVADFASEMDEFCIRYSGGRQIPLVYQEYPGPRLRDGFRKEEDEEARHPRREMDFWRCFFETYGPQFLRLRRLRVHAPPRVLEALETLPPFRELVSGWTRTGLFFNGDPGSDEWKLTSFVRLYERE